MVRFNIAIAVVGIVTGFVEIDSARAQETIIEIKDVSANTLQLSADGKRVVTANNGFETAVWDLATKEKTVVISEKSHTKAWFLDDGKTIIGTNYGGAAAETFAGTYDIATGKRLHKFPGTVVEATRSGIVVVYQSEVKRATAWNATTGKELVAWDYNESGPIAISRDGKTLASPGLVDDKPGVRLFDIATGKERPGIAGVPSKTLLFSADGRLLAVQPGGKFSGGDASIWDISDAAKRPKLTVTYRNLAPLRTFSPDGSTLTSEKGILDVKTLKPRGTFEGRKATFAEDADVLVGATTDGKQFIVADKNGKVLNIVNVGVRFDSSNFSISPDGSRIACWSQESRSFIVVQAGAAKADGKALAKIAEIPFPKSQIPLFSNLFSDRGEGRLFFSPDGKFIVSSVGDLGHGSNGVWDVAAGKPVFSFRSWGWWFTPDGNSLISEEYGPREETLLGNYHLRTGKRLEMMNAKKGTPHPFHMAVLSPDRKTMAAVVGVRKGKPEIVLIDTTKPMAKGVTLANSNPNRIVFSADSKLLAVNDNSFRVTLWNLETRAQVPTTATKARHRLGFSDGGKIIATTDLDKAYFYTVETGQLHKEVDAKTGHTVEVQGLAFAPTAQKFASYDKAGAVVLKNWETGKSLARIEAHKGAVYSAAFSPDGKTLATAGADGMLRIWTVE